MATITLGSNAQTTLTALTFQRGGLLPADVATIAQSILDDGGEAQDVTGPQGNAGKVWPGAFGSQGLLYVPNRGVLKVMPGDVVGVDANGWPILVSAAAISGLFASTSWTHS